MSSREGRREGDYERERVVVVVGELVSGEWSKRMLHCFFCNKRHDFLFLRRFPW